MCWGCLLQRCWWHHPSCPCWLRSCSNKTTDTSLVGADVFMACTQSSGQESPQETSPLGENKTFPNLPLYNLIALQSFCKNMGETLKLYHSRCDTHFQMSRRRQSEHFLFFPARLYGTGHTQSRHPCSYNFHLPNPAPGEMRASLLVLSDPCHVPSDIHCCDLPAPAGCPRGLFVLEHVKMETLTGRVQ